MTLPLRLFLWFWSALWTAGLPIILTYLWRRGRKDPDYFKHLRERFGWYSGTLPGAVWIHAVSLGELRSAVPLIRALLDRGEFVVTTHFTPAGRREAERVFADDIALGRMLVVWVPFETKWAYAGFFRSFQPKYGLVMEIEIWPRMVFAARAARVPLFMCNAQYPVKSMARDASRLKLRHEIMRGFAGALVKSQLQADRFTSIGMQNVVVSGELRFDQPIPPQLITAGVAARRDMNAQNRRVITIASAIEGEDPIYLHAIAALRDHHLRHGLALPMIIYVPRRPERFEEVAAALSQVGLNVAKRSIVFAPDLVAKTPPPIGVDVLLGDSLGEMYFYLAMADQVIVGGGFNPKGAHNIIEPLALRKPVITGPHTGTIEYPFAEAQTAGVAISVADAAALSAALINGFQPEAQAIDAFFAAHSGGTAKTLAALPDLMARAWIRG